MASFIGVQSRFVGGGVGLASEAAAFEKVAIPIGFEESAKFRVFNSEDNRRPNEALRTDVDGELLREDVR